MDKQISKKLTNTGIGIMLGIVIALLIQILFLTATNLNGQTCGNPPKGFTRICAPSIQEFNWILLGFGAIVGSIIGYKKKTGGRNSSQL